MDTFIRLAVAAVFLFIIYRKKISPSVKKKKKEKEETVAALTSTSGSADVSLPSPVPVGYKVLVFDYAEHSGEADFASQIETRLALLISDIQAMGSFYKVKFMIINNSVLICLLSYELPAG